MGRAVLLLDVDGCLLSDLGWDGPPHVARVRLRGVPHELRYVPERLVALRRLDVQVRWCTSWSGDVDILERTLKLPAFADALAGSGVDVTDHDSVVGAKLLAAMAVVEVEGRPLVWADDEAIPTSGPELRRLEAAHSLLLRVPHASGLQPAHFEQIDRWLATVEQHRSA